MRPLRRYELLLPLHFNDGAPVPRELLRRSQAELESEFGALSAESQVIRGFDRETGSEADKLIRLFVDVPDTAENRAFFQQTQGRLAERFQQREIKVTSYPVEEL